jgi:hypothetical protein
VSDLLDRIRVRIPENVIVHKGKVKTFFDILANNGGLTEEYLYTHQPTGKSRIAVYSTSREPVGFLDDSERVRQTFDVLQGAAVLVARKGYGGRLSVINDDSFIVHEDGYAIKPKPLYAQAINLTWFAGHYSTEFQGYRSSLEGIGDFPRAKLNIMNVVIPKPEWQLRCSKDGTCSACLAFDARKSIDWKAKEQEFVDLCRSNAGKSHDVIVACSGGKDSTWQVVKCLELGLKPLAVTATTDHCPSSAARTWITLDGFAIMSKSRRTRRSAKNCQVRS